MIRRFGDAEKETQTGRRTHRNLKALLALGVGGALLMISAIPALAAGHASTSGEDSRRS